MRTHKMEALAFQLIEQFRFKDDEIYAEWLRHLFWVADKCCGNNDYYVVALLHEIIEDTDLEIKDLEQMDFSSDVILAIDCISMRINESYDNYMERVFSNDIAKEVKKYDMIHNSIIARYANPTATDADRCIMHINRLKKYYFNGGENKC